MDGFGRKDRLVNNTYSNRNNNSSINNNNNNNNFDKLKRKKELSEYSAKKVKT